MQQSEYMAMMQGEDVQLVLQSVRHLRHHLPFIAEKRAALGTDQS